MIRICRPPPPIWYLSNLSTPKTRVSGVTFPGVPGIVLGHNEFIAWGATNLGPDVQDLFIEKFNDKNQFQTANGWQNAKVRTEEIKGAEKPAQTRNGNYQTRSFGNRRRRCDLRAKAAKNGA